MPTALPYNAKSILGGYNAVLLARWNSNAYTPQELNLMEEEELERLCFALSNVTRLRMIRLLSSTSDMRLMTKMVAQYVNCSDHVASKHLGILADSKIVEKKREGNFSLWLLLPGRVTEICTALFNLMGPANETLGHTIVSQSG